MKIHLSVFLLTTCLYSEIQYTLCIDGGGSKTLLQVLDKKGTPLLLEQKEKKTLFLLSGGSNINTVGLQNTKQAITDLFMSTKVQEKDLLSLLPFCQVIAGIAGTGSPQNKQAIHCFLQELGIPEKQISIKTDADLALQLLEGDGIVLIAGTGSICLGKHEGTLFRVGGLGKILGDEGSGYKIGLLSFQAALAEEYGWGSKTTLSPILKELFQTQELKTLIPKINLGEISSMKIASCAPFIFEEAHKGDQIALGIIWQTAKELAELLNKQLLISGLSKCSIYLFGGIFKGPYADDFIAKIQDFIPTSKELVFLNQSTVNTTTLFAQKQINN